MPYGYTGNILVADLTAGTVRIDRHDDAYYRKYMGGAALAMDYILRDVPANSDPLGPENVLVFAVGPLTGTPISGQSRMSVNAKSPLTGVIGDAQVGGFFPAELKFAGFDAVVIKGASPTPVYLYIKDGVAEIRDATKYWGMGTGELQDTMEADLGDSKKQLKAIVCRGTGKVAVKDPAKLKELTQWGAKNVRINLAMAGLQKYGTAETVMAQQAVGGLPTKNWESGVFDRAEEISGERMYDTI